MGCSDSKPQGSPNKVATPTKKSEEFSVVPASPKSPPLPVVPKRSLSLSLENNSSNVSTASVRSLNSEISTPLSSLKGTLTLRDNDVLCTPRGEFGIDCIFQHIDQQKYGCARRALDELLETATDRSTEQIVAKIGLTILQKSQASKRARFNATGKEAASAKRILHHHAKGGSTSALLGLAEFHRSSANYDAELKYCKKAAATSHPLGHLRHALCRLRTLLSRVERGTIAPSKVHTGRDAMMQDIIKLSRRDTKEGVKAQKAVRVLMSVVKEDQGTVRDLTRAQKLLDGIIDLEDDPRNMHRIHEKLVWKDFGESEHLSFDNPSESRAALLAVNKESSPTYANRARFRYVNH